MEIHHRIKLLVGTYTQNNTDGIYVLEMDLRDGKLSMISKTNHVTDPSFLCISKGKKFVYAVNESGKPLDDSISAFSLDRDSGTLSFVNKLSTKGTHPCFVTINDAGKNLFVANYTSGSLSSFKINENGSLDVMTQNIQHIGSSVNIERQSQAHVHASVLLSNEAYLFATDLGTDEIVSYAIEQKNGNCLLTKTNSTKVRPGSGPRHLIFNKTMTNAYLTLEMSGEVSVFDYKSGQFHLLQTLKLESDDFKGNNSAADIHLSKDEKFLYASNRGNSNSISVFNVQASNGHLQFVERYSTHGITPRNFAIDPSNQFLLVANQGSHSISVFEKNKETGKLNFLNCYTEIEYPVCIKFIDN